MTVVMNKERHLINRDSQEILREMVPDQNQNSNLNSPEYSQGDLTMREPKSGEKVSPGKTKRKMSLKEHKRQLSNIDMKGAFRDKNQKAVNISEMQDQ